MDSIPFVSFLTCYLITEDCCTKELGFRPIFASNTCVYKKCISMYIGHILTHFHVYRNVYQVYTTLFSLQTPVSIFWPRASVFRLVYQCTLGVYISISGLLRFCKLALTLYFYLDSKRIRFEPPWLKMKCTGVNERVQWTHSRVHARKTKERINSTWLKKVNWFKYNYQPN